MFLIQNAHSARFQSFKNFCPKIQGEQFVDDLAAVYCIVCVSYGSIKYFTIFVALLSTTF